MKIYREWVYKVCFYIFCQIAAMVGLILSGDVLRIWEEGKEFDIAVNEVRSK